MPRVVRVLTRTPSAWIRGQACLVIIQGHSEPDVRGGADRSAGHDSRSAGWCPRDRTAACEHAVAMDWRRWRAASGALHPLVAAHEPKTPGGRRRASPGRGVPQ